MPADKIRIFNASEHNLKNIDLEIPRKSLTVITGLSGSGKSSLAFDTIYAEGQRRYIESLSAYARQFLDQLPKPHVERIEGLSPAISIEQKTVSRNPRSTVGTVTEVYDHLRLLFSTIGEASCPKCGKQLQNQTADSISETAFSLPNGTRLMILAPVIRGRKGEYQALFQKLLRDGFVRAKIDGDIVDLDPTTKLKRMYRHDISVVVDRVYVNPEMKSRIKEAIKTALRMSDNLVILETLPDRKGDYPTGTPWEGERLFSSELGCPEHGPQVVDMAPRVFSFNSPYGWCPECEGIGTVSEVAEEKVVPNPKATLRESAVLPWKWFFDRRGGDYKKKTVQRSEHGKQLHKVIEVYEIDIDTPWESLEKKHRSILLYGFGKKNTFPKEWVKNRKYKSLASWSGVMGRVQKKLAAAQDDSEWEALSEYLSDVPCPVCDGARLRSEALAVTLGGKNIADICTLGITDALNFMKSITLNERQRSIVHQPMKEVIDRLGFLQNVGLHYLTLDRKAGTLSGGEAQRIRLATQIGSRLTGVLYILDEPSIGLHQRDNEKLINSLADIRDLGNTVLVVEHDEQTIRTADFVVDLGPGAGRLGGEIIASGSPKQIARNRKSATGRYLNGEVAIEAPEETRKPGENWLEISGCSLHNLKEQTLKVPCGLMVGITGVSGSGKSSLIMETMLPLLMNHCYKTTQMVVGPYDQAEGVDNFDRCIHVNQQPIGRTPRSNPATYTKVFDAIRELFALTPDARMKGYTKSRFSFNVKGGRCEECSGQGAVKVEMNFLPDVYVECTSCQGRRYNAETLLVNYKGKSIADVLEMTIDDALELFESVPQIKSVLQTLRDVGLGYIHLGQSATTLSGGEAQRIKLARELSKKNTGRTMYILDEPTTGLHFADVHRLLDVMNRLVDTGSTMVVIEHNLDIIKCCDWLIDIGPEGGDEGGEIIAEGPPKEIAKKKESHTGRFLKEL